MLGTNGCIWGHNAATEVLSLWSEGHVHYCGSSPDLRSGDKVTVDGSRGMLHVQESSKDHHAVNIIHPIAPV